MIIPVEMLHCDDIMCENPIHILQISEYCASIIKCCVDTGNEDFPKMKAHKSNKPYWNSNVKAKRDAYLFWSHIWRECGQPKDGIMEDLMRKTKREYHYAVRYIWRNEEKLRKMKMEECILFNKYRDFWME